MPELPEVETVVRDLNQKIKGDTVVGFESFWPKALKNIKLEKFKKEIVKRKILGAWRIGKNIFIDLSGGKTLYLHLKMTGHLLIKKQETRNKKQKKEIKNPMPTCLPDRQAGRQEKSKLRKDFFGDKVNQYIRHVFYLEDKKGIRKNLEFSDLRKFGKIVWVEKKKIKDLPEIKSLGMDAMSEKFDFKLWQEILKKKKKMAVGIILMDQNLIAGVGNIYRAEILFAAGINPWRLAGDLSNREKRAVFLKLKKILNLAIKLRGTSDSDYRDTSGAPGGFQKVLKVYNKEGERCEAKNCQGIIQRKKLAQRSVFWCEKCQK